MKIIGHRGARGVALENSLASMRAALATDVDTIEFDIHRTIDNVLVVAHDPTTGRIADQDLDINKATLDELRQLHLKNGQQIPTLEEVLQLAGNRPICIDVKDTDCAETLVRLLERHPAASVSFASGIGSELQRLHQLRPELPTYLYFLKAKYLVPRPFLMVRLAHSVNATGIGVDKLFMMNPLVYYLARRHGLQIYTYSVGSLILARLFAWIYPHLDLCTSQPERLTKYFKGVR